jgi:hypothetical protein
MSSRKEPVTLVAWNWPLNVSVNVAGLLPMTPVWIVVELNEPSAAIGIEAIAICWLERFPLGEQLRPMFGTTTFCTADPPEET